MRVAFAGVGAVAAVAAFVAAPALSDQARAATSTTPSTSSMSVAVGRAVPAGFAPISVTFISNQRGWVLGTAPCSKKQCAVVLRTDDGGKSWSRIPAPVTAAQPYGEATDAISQLRFATQREGYTAGGALWETHDGGTRWVHHRTVAGIPNAVVTDLVVSGNTVYALAAGSDRRYRDSNSHVRLVSARVTNGKFHVVTDLGTNQDASDLAASGGIVYFVDHASIHGNGRLIRVHGQKVTRTHLPSYGCYNVAASTPTALLLVCGDGAGGGAMGSRVVYGSSNSGHRFIRLHAPTARVGYDNDGLADAGHGHAVIGAYDAGSAALESTANGARTWHTTLQINEIAFTDLGFEDPTHGVVIATPGSAEAPAARLYGTSDAGATWHRNKFN